MKVQKEISNKTGVLYMLDVVGEDAKTLILYWRVAHAILNVMSDAFIWGGVGDLYVI